jgi:hypothetical protein
MASYRQAARSALQALPIIVAVTLCGGEVERMLRGNLKKCGVTEQNKAA